VTATATSPIRHFSTGDSVDDQATHDRVETKGLEPSTPALQNRGEASAYIRLRPPGRDVGRHRSLSNALGRGVDSKLGSKLRVSDNTFTERPRTSYAEVLKLR